MKKYKLEYEVSFHKGTVEVEASNEEEAINKAMVIARSRMPLPDAVKVKADKFKIK